MGRGLWDGVVGGLCDSYPSGCKLTRYCFVLCWAGWRAQAELLETMRAAAPATISTSKEEWLALRSATDPSSQHQRAAGKAEQGAERMATLPPQLPRLPRGFMARDAVLAAVKAQLCKHQEAAAEGNVLTVCMRGESILPPRASFPRPEAHGATEGESP